MYDLHQFAVTMSRHRYPNWRLRHLNLSYATGKAKFCAVAMVTALPGLHTFNGVGRTEFLAEAQAYATDYPAERLPWD